VDAARLSGLVSSALVARLERPADVVPIVRAALDVDVVYVALREPPAPGRHTLQLWVAESLVAALLAEVVGSGRDGEYPLRLRPLDPAHVAELEALAAGARTARPPAPVLPRGIDPNMLVTDDDRTLRSERVAGEDASAGEERTLASRAPFSGAADSAPRPPQPSSPDGEIRATTLFDPEGLLRAPPTPSSDDSLTLPRAPGARTSSRPPGTDRFTDDESQTLPGSSRAPSADAPDVSWNVRIAPTTKDPLCGRVIGGGKYVLESVIGTGANGIVFKASHRDLGRTTAIKVLNPTYRDDPNLLAVFRAEARAASLLEHPNVARVYDYGQEPDGLVYIVMEYLSGYTLGSVLGARRKLAPSRAVDVMVQVCAGLSAAHDRAIVHRDVKPDNIVLVPSQDDEGRPVEMVKVCDFGIAALGASADAEETAVGTPEYMAPEQSTGGSVTPAADVYACGVVLYEMVAGEVPFRSDQAFRILMKHRAEAPRPPSELTPDVPPALEQVILRCMEKVPAHRYKTARDLRAELRRIADPRA